MNECVTLSTPSDAEESDIENQKSMSIFTDDEMRYVTRIDSTDTTFHDVCGMDEAKKLLKLPLLHYLFPNTNASFLLFGPPGTGKSLILKALVGEAKGRPETFSTKFFSFKFCISDLVYLSAPGTVEILLRKLFMQAHMEKPSIIFIEGLDGLTDFEKNSDNLRVRNAFCKEMKDIRDGVSVMCTTNKPETLVDYPNVLSHFHHLIYISLPNKEDRLKILKKIFTPEVCNDFEEEHFEKLAKETRGQSGSQLDALYNNALQRVYCRMKDASQPVQITVDDILILNRAPYLDLNIFDEIAQSLSAKNGNIPLEPLEKLKLSRCEKFLAFLAEIFL